MGRPRKDAPPPPAYYPFCFNLTQEDKELMVAIAKQKFLGNQTETVRQLIRAEARRLKV